MNVSTGEGPSDAVAGMDPNFVGKEGHRLFGHVCTLTSDGSVPILLGLNAVRQSQDGCEERGENKPHFDEFLSLHLCFSFADLSRIIIAFAPGYHLPAHTHSIQKQGRFGTYPIKNSARILFGWSPHWRASCFKLGPLAMEKVWRILYSPVLRTC